MMHAAAFAAAASGYDKLPFKGFCAVQEQHSEPLGLIYGLRVIFAICTK
jgi:hypothetical protein